MKKAIIIGCPGSGKTTFSKALHDLTKIPLYHLDSMNWNDDRTTVEKSVFRERLERTLQKSEWMIDGNYGSTMEMLLVECDTVYFLDYPVEVCINGVKERLGKPRIEVPWVDVEDEEHFTFLAFVQNFQQSSRPYILTLLEKYSSKNVHTFKSREEAHDYLNHLSEKHSQ